MLVFFTFLLIITLASSCTTPNNYTNQLSDCISQSDANNYCCNYMDSTNKSICLPISKNMTSQFVPFSSASTYTINCGNAISNSTGGNIVGSTCGKSKPVKSTDCWDSSNQLQSCCWISGAIPPTCYWNEIKFNGVYIKANLTLTYCYTHKLIMIFPFLGIISLFVI